MEDNTPDKDRHNPSTANRNVGGESTTEEHHERLLAPSQVVLPLPPVPTSAEGVKEWMEVYRAHIELERLDVELVKLKAERMKAAGELARGEDDVENRRREREKNELEMIKLRFDLAAADRTEKTAAAEAVEAMVYTFADVVNDETVRKAISTLDAWSRRRPGTPISVQLTSPGGSVLSGLALYDFLLSLRARGHQLTVVALGFAASMGAVLLQAGDVRVMGPNAHFMVHEISSWAHGTTSSMAEDLETTKKLEKRLLNILCERSTFTPAQLARKWKKTDVWWDADEAVSLGFADRIGLL